MTKRVSCVQISYVAATPRGRSHPRNASLLNVARPLHARVRGELIQGEGLRQSRTRLAGRPHRRLQRRLSLRERLVSCRHAERLRHLRRRAAKDLLKLVACIRRRLLRPGWLLVRRVLSPLGSHKAWTYSTSQARVASWRFLLDVVGIHAALPPSPGHAFQRHRPWSTGRKKDRPARVLPRPAQQNDR